MAAGNPRLLGEAIDVDEENDIIKLANQIAKKDLAKIAEKTDEVSSFDEARVVVAYKQAAVRSKGEARQAMSGIDMDGLDPEEVRHLALKISDIAGVRKHDDDDE